VPPERSQPTEDNRVVPFRPRRAARSRWGWPTRRPPSDGPVEDLAKYEQAEPKDDYRHRMKMNALAAVVTILLVITGVWLAEKIAALRKVQDCVLSGRQNCTPIDVPPMKRN
jgi:hypothetical protein